MTKKKIRKCTALALIETPAVQEEIKEEPQPKRKRRNRYADLKYSVESGEWESGLPPPFLFLMLELAKRQKDARTMAGSAEWFSFPVEYALASGLWLLIISYAKQLGMALNTEREVAIVSETVDKFVNVALVVEYQTQEGLVRAADDFEKQVVATVNRAISCGFQPGMDIHMDLWRELRDGDFNRFMRYCRQLRTDNTEAPAHLVFQKPVAMFFADLIKQANAFGAALKESLDRACKLNQGYAGTFYSEYGYQMADSEEFYMRCFDVKHTELLVVQQMRAGDGANKILVSIWGLRDLPGTIAKSEKWAVVARRLPVKFREVFREPELSDTFFRVDLEWLNAQLLLAAGDLPDREFILFEEFTAALAKAKGYTASELARETIERWKRTRGFSCPDQRKMAEVVDLLKFRAEPIIKEWTVGHRKDCDRPDYAGLLMRRPKKAFPLKKVMRDLEDDPPRPKKK
jgi:hypothetical protein